MVRRSVRTSGRAPRSVDVAGDRSALGRHSRWVRTVTTIATKMDQIAHRAGVAPATVYAVVGSKRGALDALIDQIDLAGGVQELQAAIRATPDPRAQLREMVDFDCRLFERGAAIISVAAAAGAAEPDLAGMLAEGRRRGRAGRLPVVQAWASAGALRPDVNADEAMDVLSAMCSPALYQSLVGDGGWHPQRFREGSRARWSSSYLPRARAEAWRTLSLANAPQALDQHTIGRTRRSLRAAAATAISR